MRRTRILAIATFFCWAAPLGAATPEWVNYQGVLRDGSGAPRSGPVEMTFRFFDAPAGGNEILVDAHRASGSGPVIVAGGLFSVPLGSGDVSDGAAVLPFDPYMTLAEMFRDFPEVWMQIEIAMGGPAEVLDPRVRVDAVPFAHVAGRSDEAAVADLAYDSLFASTASHALTADSATTATTASSAATATTAGSATTATNATQLGGVAASGYLNTSGASQTKAGTLTVNGFLIAGGNDIRFGSPGASIQGLGTGILLQGGDQATDDIELRAGPFIGSGAVLIEGQDTMWLQSGNGNFDFSNDATSAHLATLDGTGTFTAEGDLVARGNDLRFGAAGAAITAGSFALTVVAGDADLDDLVLRGGNSIEDGQIVISGASQMSFRSGSSLYQFLSGPTGLELASIDSAGNLQLDGLLDDDLAVTLGLGTVITVQGSPSALTIDGLNLDLNLGNNLGDRVDIAGALQVTGTKNFVQNHPVRSDLAIYYTALEGDEAGTYTRGSARLSGGVARVALGESFAWVTHPNVGLTAQVTPRGAWADLYVESLSTRELVVRSRDGSAGEAAFDYIVHGLRIGYEDFPVVQPRDRDRPIPAEGAHSGLLTAHPELARYRPIERFLHAAGTPPAPQAVDTSEAKELRRAIGEQDPRAETLAAAGAGAAPAAAPQPEPAVARQGGSRHEAADPLPSAAGDRAAAGVVRAAPPMDGHGDVYARSFRPRAGDLASLVDVDGAVEAGDILVIDPDRPGIMRLSRIPADTAVLGIVAAEPGLVLGAGSRARDSREDETGTTQVPVVLSGVAVCRADASFGAIRPGDLLTTSPTPGHAMRADSAVPGTILGKALEPLAAGTGAIRILVTLR